MLEPVWITLIAIVVGSVLASIAYWITTKRIKSMAVPLELWTGYLVNSLTVTTLGCFIFNIVCSVLISAITRHPVQPIKIEGNEAIIFWIFVYAFGQAGLSLRRAVLSAT